MCPPKYSESILFFRTILCCSTVLICYWMVHPGSFWGSLSVTDLQTVRIPFVFCAIGPAFPLAFDMPTSNILLSVPDFWSQIFADCGICCELMLILTQLLCSITSPFLVVITRLFVLRRWGSQWWPVCVPYEAWLVCCGIVVKRVGKQKREKKKIHYAMAPVV